MDDLTDELLEVIGVLPVEPTGRLPDLAEQAWPDCVRIALRAWARGPRPGPAAGNGGFGRGPPG